MTKGVRPLVMKEQGTKVRTLKPVLTTRQVVNELLSTTRGLPPEDESSGLVRLTPGGVVKPTKETATMETIKIKLQEHSHVSAVFKLHDVDPMRGFEAARLLLPAGKEKTGVRGKQVAMAAGPWRAKITIPKGKMALKRFPEIRMSHNVIMLDENGTVTFGVTTYPPWMKQKLRAEIFSAFLEMGQRNLPVDPSLYEVVRTKLSDPALCGQYSKVETRLLPPWPPPSPPRTPPSRKGKQASPKTAAPAKKTKPAAVVGEVARIVRESGAWGGHRRWFLAEWAHEGYDPSWEAWRSKGEGEPGTPVVSCCSPKSDSNLGLEHPPTPGERVH